MNPNLAVDWPVTNVETFVVEFPSLIQADYWLRKFVLKFSKDVVFCNRHAHKIQFNDNTVWYFKSNQSQREFKGLHNAIVYPAEAIYIILDDVERTKLDTYEGV